MKGKKAPIRLANLVGRIKRKLPPGETFRGKPGPRGGQELGTFYHVKADNSVDVVDPIAFAKRLGVLRGWEAVV